MALLAGFPVPVISHHLSSLQGILTDDQASPMNPDFGQPPATNQSLTIITQANFATAM